MKSECGLGEKSRRRMERSYTALPLSLSCLVSFLFSFLFLSFLVLFLGSLFSFFLV